MVATKKTREESRRAADSVRNAKDRRAILPLPGERARVRADVDTSTPHSAFRTPPSAKLVPLLLSWFSTNARDLPWRRTRDPYAIWVSEIMLQQTQVKTVIPYWERWMRALPTIQSTAKAPPAKLHKLWEGLGYYTRVRNLQKAAQEIVARHDGKFPENFDAILALSGIGRYTAGAISSIAFNQPTPILDGNVIRVLTRLFGIAASPREKQTNAQLWQLAGDLVNIASEQTTSAPEDPHPKLLPEPPGGGGHPAGRRAVASSPADGATANPQRCVGDQAPGKVWLFSGRRDARPPRQAGCPPLRLKGAARRSRNQTAGQPH